jgi:hypothetical protein
VNAPADSAGGSRLWPAVSAVELVAAATAVGLDLLVPSLFVGPIYKSRENLESSRISG